MKTFKYFLKIEFKRLFNWITVILALLFFALSVYFILDASNKYKDTLNKTDNFQKIEQSKAKYFKKITTLGEQGFRIGFVPSPLSIFFYKSGAFSDLSANLNIAERLNLTGSYKGQHMFREQSVMYADFYGLHILFGSLIVLIYSFLSFRYREYLKILNSLGGFKKVYIFISGARLLLLGLYFMVVTVAGAGLALVHGIIFTGSDYLYVAGYLGLWLLAVLVMFSAGALIGSIKYNPVGVTMLVVTWVFLFYISPLIVSQVANSISDRMKSIYQLEKEKWEALMVFENRAIEEEGRYKDEKASSPSERKLIESFWNREYKAMQAIEKKMEEEMRDKIKTYNWLTLISPSTFLSSTACELSGKGYGSLADFYKYVQDLKHKFCLFYKDKKFYSENKEKGVESFIKAEENIFYGSKRLPPNFKWGLFQLLVLLIVFQLGSYFSHRKAFFRVTGKAAVNWDPASLKPHKGSHPVYQIEEEGYNQRLYNHLYEMGHFLYLCHPDRLPGDIDAGDFLQLSAALLGVSPPVSNSLAEKPLGELTRFERFGVLMEVVELAERGGMGHFLFYDLTDGMPIAAAVQLKACMAELLKGDIWVVLLLMDQLVSDSGKGKSFGIREAETWADQVDAFKGILDKK